MDSSTSKSIVNLISLGNLTNQSLNDEAVFDMLLETKQFLLNDPFVVTLIEKSINLGFNWDAIKETLRRTLVQMPPFGLAELNKGHKDLKSDIDEDKFIEQLILMSIQMESSASHSQKQHNKLMQQQQQWIVDDANDDYGREDYGNEEDATLTGFSNLTSSTLTGEESFDYYQIKQQMYVQQQQQQQQQQQHQQIQKQLQMKMVGGNIGRAITNSNMIQSSIQLMSSNSSQQAGQKKPLSAQQRIIQQENEYIQDCLNRLNDKSNLRPIIVDSNDVAMSLNKQLYLFSRVKAVVDFFEKRHHQIYVIMSMWRKEQIMNSTMNDSNGSTLNPTSSSSPQLTPDQAILIELEKKGQLHFTPSKRVGSKRIVCDDDSAILKFAATKAAIIVSNDNFKRFLNYSEDFKTVIEERVLMYSFIEDTFMPAEDPLGKNGPSLDNFLRFEAFVNSQYMKRCPYKKKCTYGSKCKFWHPERTASGQSAPFKTAHQSVLEDVQEQKKRFEIVMNNERQSMINSNNSNISLATHSTNFKLAQSNNRADVDRNELAKQNHLRFLQPNSMLSSFESNTLNRPHQFSRAMGPIADPKTSSNVKGMSNVKTNTSRLFDTNNSLFLGSYNPMLKSSMNDLKQQDMGNELLKPDFILENEKKREPSVTSATGGAATGASDDVGTLKARLTQRISVELAEKVLNEYKDETDIEKLVFLAEGFSFDL